MNRFRRILQGRTWKLLAAAGLLTLLYRAADWPRLATLVQGLHAGWLAAALALFVPQTCVSACRWRMWVAPLARIGWGESCRQLLAAAALNLAAPSKLGDLTKAAMLPLSDARQRIRAASLAVAEKATDVAALAGWLALGGLWSSGAATVGWCLLALGGAACFVGERREEPSRGGRLVRFVALSLTLWFLHLLQIAAFIWAVGVETPLGEILARVPLAIFAGLLPVSLWGIGPRDAALVYLFADAPPAAMAVVGLLTALRYLLPGAVGIAFLPAYFPATRAASPDQPGPVSVWFRRRVPTGPAVVARPNRGLAPHG